MIAKIRNQASVLKVRGHPLYTALSAIAGRVRSGDPDNSEAHAARLYWPALLDDFRRSDDGDRRDALLNYGYAVIRAAIARACVASGLLPAFGVHHASKSNAFNLVDDLIEPFRPVVDRRVAEYSAAAADEELSLEDRRYMAGILNVSVLVGGESFSVLSASEAMATSFVRVLDEHSHALLELPVLNPLTAHDAEHEG